MSEPFQKEKDKKTFTNLLYSLVSELKKEVIRSYYFIWGLLFGAGVYMGIKMIPSVRLPVYAHYVLIAIMFLFLLVSLYIYIKSARGEKDKTGRKTVMFLVIVPAVIFFICGYIVPYSGEGEMLPVPEGSLTNKSVGIRVQGRVVSHPELLYGNTHFDLILKGSDHEVLQNGDALKVIIKDPCKYNIQRDDFLNIGGEVSVSGNDFILKADSNSIGFSERETFFDRLFGFRQRIYNCINQTYTHYLDYDTGPFARALILGDRTGISERHYDMFRKSGTAHLMAISGMHISFLTAFIFIILEKICSRHLLIAFIIIMLLLYNFILDLRASVMRSTIWVICAAVAGGWNREFKSSYILCISFIIMLLLNPGFIGDPGFWLSFSAMAGIVFVYPVIRNLFAAAGIPQKAIGNHFTGTILITVSVQLICGPLLLYYFNSLPLVSPLSNLFILPFFYTLILLLFLAAFISIIWPPAAGVILKLTPAFFKPMYGIARFFSHPGLPSVEIENLPAVQLLIYYSIVFIIFLIVRMVLRKRFDF